MFNTPLSESHQRSPSSGSDGGVSSVTTLRPPPLLPVKAIVNSLSLLRVTDISVPPVITTSSSVLSFPDNRIEGSSLVPAVCSHVKS